MQETSAFHYNFWNMPVGVTSGSGNSNAGVSRFFDCEGCGDTTTATKTTDLTTARNGISDTDPITLSTRWIYVKDPSPNNDNEANWRRVNSSNVISPFNGFIMKGVSPGGSPAQTISQTLEFRGRPNTGTIDITMSNGDFRVVSGNPYPSAIDLDAFFGDNPIITSIRFWDEPKNSEYNHSYSGKSGGWGSWVPGGGPQGTYNPPTFNNYSASGIGGSAGTGSGAVYPRRYAPIGQGFEIVTNGNSGTLTFSNSHRVYQKQNGTTSTFRKPEKDTSTLTGINPDSNSSSTGVIVDSRSPHIRLNVVMHERYARQLVLGLDDRTTDGFDRGWDAPSPMDAKSGEAYFLIGDDSNRKPHVIQFLPFSKEKLIPIGFKLTKQTKLSLHTVEEIKMQGRRAFIFDKEQRTFQEFTNGKSATFNLSAGTYDNRFFVVFKGREDLAKEATEVEGRAEENVEFFQNNRLGVLEVSNPEGYDIKQALVFDMSGKLVYNQSNIGTDRTFSFPTSNLSDGVYLVKLKTVDNIEINYKTSVYNKN